MIYTVVSAVDYFEKQMGFLCKMLLKHSLKCNHSIFYLTPKSSVLAQGIFLYLAA